MDESKIRCPYCRELILEGAIKCRYCGTMLSDAPPSSGAIGGITLVKQALSGRYEIQEEIGRGGMATVYCAVQKNLNRPVALKVIHQNLVHDSEFVARFHREAQVCASLQHPNIVTVYDEGEISGVHFMAMELLDGHDLHRLIRQQGKLHVEQTLIWLAPIAEALQYAHSRGIIHRDIKSSNILVTKTDRPVLMDFGIAHAASGTRLTQTGLVIGTPEYMSPEQAEGKAIDQRTDIYSLGIVLYECLTGKVPFKADNPLSIIMKVVNEAPVPPVQLNNSMPVWLNDVVLQCMAKNPAQRFENAGKLAVILNTTNGSFIQGNKSKNNITIQHSNEYSQVNSIKGDSKARFESLEIPEWKDPVRKLWLPLVVVMLLTLAFSILINENQLEKVIEFMNELRSNFSLSAEHLHKKKNDGLPLAVQSVDQYQLSQKEHLISNLKKLNMVFVEGGSFIMGCTSEQGTDCNEDEKPAHEVFLNDFYIGAYEITYGDICHFVPDFSKYTDCFDRSMYEEDSIAYGYFLSWEDVQLFLTKLNATTKMNFRLPTEAEWEYAARGGQKSKGFRLAGSNTVEEVSQPKFQYRASPLGFVGQKKPNELGLYDMSGNVYEWCSDWYQANYYSYSPGTNPKGPNNGDFKVLRGGWSYNQFYNERYWEPKVTLRHSESIGDGLQGIRLAHDLFD